MLKHIDVLGRTNRFTRFKQEWKEDGDWLAYRGLSVNSELPYQPAVRSVKVEGVRISDYDRPQPDIGDDDRVLLERAGEWAFEHFSVCQDAGYYTFEEAVAVVRDGECGESSPGFPWNQTYANKKAALSDPAVVEKCRAYFDRLGTDEVEWALFALALKDEILRSSKVKEGKTRLFMSAPLEHHLSMVLICGKMHDKLMGDMGTWCSAGRTFQYGGWDRMMASLPYDWFIGMDQTAYDMSIFRLMFSLVYKNVARYCPKYAGKLEDLFAQALDAVCVSCRGYLLWKHTGNPSGWFLTLYLNTMALYILLSFAFLKLVPTSTRREFEGLISALLCGDDSLLSVHTSIRLTFTSAFIMQLWETLLIKVKIAHQTQDITGIEYCGAESVWRCGVLVRKPRVEKFLSSLSFTRTDDPLLRLQRAASIWYELWPCPDEARVVERYIELLFEKYPYLQKHRRALLTQQEQRHLHTGLE